MVLEVRWHGCVHDLRDDGHVGRELTAEEDVRRPTDAASGFRVDHWREGIRSAIHRELAADAVTPKSVCGKVSSWISERRYHYAAML